MKKILFILAVIAITLTSCNKGKQYIIKGTLAGIESGKAYRAVCPAANRNRKGY